MYLLIFLYYCTFAYVFVNVPFPFRIRPQNAKEKIDMNQVCTSVEPSANQICLGKDKAFTFDYVFDMDATQEIIFSDVSKPLMSG